MNPEAVSYSVRVTSTSLLDFVHEEDRARVQEGLRTLVTSASEGNLDLDCRLSTADSSTIFARSVISVHRGASGEPDVIRGVTIDVTDQKKMEISLHQAQKLESVGRLAAGVAHEINTPVQFVSDSVHFVRDAMADLSVLVGKYQTLHRSVLEGGPTLDRAAEVVQAEADADLEYILEQVPRALARSLEGT